MQCNAMYLCNVSMQWDHSNEAEVFLEDSATLDMGRCLVYEIENFHMFGKHRLPKVMTFRFTTIKVAWSEL